MPVHAMRPTPPVPSFPPAWLVVALAQLAGHEVAPRAAEADALAEEDRAAQVLSRRLGRSDPVTRCGGKAAAERVPRVGGGSSGHTRHARE